MTQEETPLAGAAPAEPAYGGFGTRLVALLLDSIILLLVTVPVLVWLFNDNMTQLLNDESLQTRINFGVNLGALVFGVICLVLMGGTPGKCLMGMKVVDAATGGALTWKQSVARQLGYFASTLPLCAGFFWILVDRRAQGWHDKLAGTLVVKTRKAA